MMISFSRLEAFWANVSKLPHPKGCWEWTASVKGFGYGQFFIDGKNEGAHRVALMVSLGRRLFRGETANHACNNPRCCRVSAEHVYLGTQSKNMHDKAAAGRAGYNRGAKSAFAKLSQVEADALRERYIAGDRVHGARALAREFGLSHTAVIGVVNNHSYR